MSAADHGARWRATAPGAAEVRPARARRSTGASCLSPIRLADMDDVEVGSVPIGNINPRDYRFVMSLARRYNAIVFWHRDRNGIDWQPLLMPLARRQGTRREAR